MQALAPVLLAAIAEPNTKAKAALETLLTTTFVNTVDAASLALIVPVVHRGLRDRSGDAKKKAARIVGDMCELINEPKVCNCPAACSLAAHWRSSDHILNKAVKGLVYKVAKQKGCYAQDMAPYVPLLMPELQNALVDPLPEVRATAAHALGSLLRGMGEQHFQGLMPWLLATLNSEVRATPALLKAWLTPHAQGAQSFCTGLPPAELVCQRCEEDVDRAMVRCAEKQRGALRRRAGPGRSAGRSRTLTCGCAAPRAAGCVLFAHALCQRGQSHPLPLPAAGHPRHVPGTKQQPSISCSAFVQPVGKGALCQDTILSPVVEHGGLTSACAQDHLGEVLPAILDGLADESEGVRDAALQAGRTAVELFAQSSLPLLLPAVENGIIHDNWRIRQSSVELLGDLLFKVTLHLLLLPACHLLYCPSEVRITALLAMHMCRLLAHPGRSKWMVRAMRRACQARRMGLQLLRR